MILSGPHTHPQRARQRVPHLHGQTEGKPPPGQAEAAARVAQALLLIQANMFVQRGPNGFRQSLPFSTQWSWKLPQIFSPTYLLGNPEIILEGYIRREKERRFLQSQTQKQCGKQTSQSTW